MMRLLLIHNSYRQKGGEDVAVSAEYEMLLARGCKVSTFWVDNDGILKLSDKIFTALHTPYSYAVKKAVYERIIEFKPDVIHVHNFFPRITPSVYDACHDARVPVVQTLHNYRTICPGALLMREGKICEECVDGTAYRAVRYGCYRESFLGTLAAARMVQFHRKRKTWIKKVDGFIALTDFSRCKFIEGGFPPDKIHVKPNFISNTTFANKERRGCALFIGRLSREKGIDTLVNAWDDITYPLIIAGEGNFPCKSGNNPCSNVQFQGKLNREEVFSRMSESLFLVMPSECYEGFPLVIAEAFAHGLPVLASRLGSMAEIVTDGVTGLHFRAGDPRDLAEKARWMFENPEECRKMGENARRVYEDKYTAEANYRILMKIYRNAERTFRKRGTK
jgi:glycosyltransferase involved in cell wall biosynthesis